MAKLSVEKVLLTNRMPFCVNALECRINLGELNLLRTSRTGWHGPIFPIYLIEMQKCKYSGVHSLLFHYPANVLYSDYSLLYLTV